MKNINFVQLREKISQIFVSGKYNQKEWAEYLNVSQPSISNYINGRIPPLEVLIKMCQLLNISLEELIAVDQYKQDYASKYIMERNTIYQPDELNDLFLSLPGNQQKAFLDLLRVIARERKK